MIKSGKNPQTINFFLFCCGSKPILKKIGKFKMDDQLVVNVLHNDCDPFYDKYVEYFVNGAIFTGGSVSFNDLSCPSWKKKGFGSRKY